MLSLSSDGTRLAVGASGEDSAGLDESNNAAADAGAAYTFRLSGGTWQQDSYVKASNPGASDFFSSVALAGNGTRLAVGAYQEDSSATGIGGPQQNEGAPNSGALYLYDAIDTTWSTARYIKASNSGADDELGHCAALSTDGTTIAVGAYHEASSATGINGDQTNDTAKDAGAVYVIQVPR